MTLVANRSSARCLGVVGAPGDEARAAEVDVRPDLLDHLLGGADEVPRPPALDRLAPEAPAARGHDLRLGLPDEHLG